MHVKAIPKRVVQKFAKIQKSTICSISLRSVAAENYVNQCSVLTFSKK